MVIDFQSVISDPNILRNRCIFRKGFAFTAITHPGNVYDAIIIRSPENALCSSLKPSLSLCTLEEHIDFINQHKIEKALIIAENIEFLTRCPTLKYLKIIPADSASNDFDYSPLYKMPQIKSLQCSTVYGAREEFSTDIDCTRIHGIENIHVTNSRYRNFNAVDTLKSLGLSQYSKDDLDNAFASSKLDTLSIFSSKIKTLNGVQRSSRLQCLYLYYNRLLENIATLHEVRKTLRALRIENCPKIDDFSVLAELENLELLELSGNNTLPNLDFIKCMKNLKTFVFSMNVLDGNLSPCLELSYVYSEKNRKHYNLKDVELPKGQYVRGNEDIEVWRRLE